jgi:hypothetical protein
MSAAKWTARTSHANIITTGLDALATAGWATSAASPIDNGDAAARRLYLDLELELSADTASVAASGARIDIYLIPALGGTNFPTPPGTSAAAVPPGYWRGAFSANPSAVWRRGAFLGIVLPSCPFAIVLQNNLGVSLPANSNVLRGWSYTEEGV